MSFAPDWVHGVLATLVVLYMVGDVVKTVAYVRYKSQQKKEPTDALS